MAALSKQQRILLDTLNDDNGQDAHAIGQVLRRKLRDSPGSYYDRAHAALRRLEIRGLVRREKQAQQSGSSQRVPSKLFITSAGLAELESL